MLRDSVAAEISCFRFYYYIEKERKKWLKGINAKKNKLKDKITAKITQGSTRMTV